MSLRSMFSSVESERRWFLEMAYIFDNKFSLPIYEYRVPKSLRETKPEAYTPQQIGLGPYNHLRPELYALMQKHKLDAVLKFLNSKSSTDPEIFRKVVEALIEWEPILRACYAQYLDLDIQTLALILAIDGLYLLQFLDDYVFGEPSQLDPEMKELNIRDIMILDNQIPSLAYYKIKEVVQRGKTDPKLYQLDIYFFDRFCEKESPLKVYPFSSMDQSNLTQVHLLHRMYFLIVNCGDTEMSTEFVEHICRYRPPSVDDIEMAVGFLAEQGVPGATASRQILSFMTKVPWDKILALFKIGGTSASATDDHDHKQNLSVFKISCTSATDDHKQNLAVEEIDIPSVSQMTEFAGIKFKITTGGIRDVKFLDHEEEKQFYLPVIKLNSTSEIVLRNLVAFEAAAAKPGSTLELAEYVDLMCGIIDTPKDVSILKNEKIIESEMSDEEIARIFNGISKSTKKTDKKSKIDETIEGVNKKYDSIRRVKVERFLKKYVPASFKFLGLLITIVVLVLLVINAYCSEFGCRRLFGKK